MQCVVRTANSKISQRTTQLNVSDTKLPERITARR